MAKKKKEAKKKEPKVEKVFGEKEPVEEIKPSEEAPENSSTSDVDDFLGVVEEPPEDNLTEKQRAKLEKINNVKNKISKILKTSNIEIIDENFGDEYETGSADVSDEQSQQDYDSLKAMFGGKDGKKDEITLTIDDFDYTYIGQYLEEYDLLHMKNIKKVRIIRKKSPKLKKFLIAAAIVLLVGTGAVLGFLFTRPEAVYLKEVTLNQSERLYYVNENFEDTGLYFIAEYSNGVTKRIKLTSAYYNAERSTGIIDRSGENNETISFKAVGNANLVFSYEGFYVTYAVTVSKKNETDVHAFYTDKIFNMAPESTINDKILTVLAEYQDEEENPTEIDFSEVELYINGNKCTTNNEGFFVENGTTSGSEIEIKFGKFTKTLVYGQNYV